jgi:hypothetical protein
VPNNIAPFEIPYAITLDSNGNGAYTYKFANDYYYGGTISGTTNGTPQWSLQRNGIFIKPAVGASVAISTGVMAPGTALTLQIMGGLPNAQVTGMIYGNKSPDPSLLVLSIADMPQSPGIIQVPQRFQLKTSDKDPSPFYIVPYDGVTHTYTFTLPPGALTFRIFLIQPTGTPPAAWPIFTVDGDQTWPKSGFRYVSYSGQGGSSTTVIAADTSARIWPVDSQLIVNAQLANNGTNAGAFVFMIEASLMQDLVKASISSDGNTNASDDIGITDNGALVVRQLTNMQPTAWQAAQFATPLVGGIGAGGSQTIAAAPGAGLAVYLHDVVIIPGTAGTFGGVLDNGIRRGEWSYANGNPVPLPFKGFKCSANQAVLLTNDGPALGTESGIATYSIGPA